MVVDKVEEAFLGATWMLRLKCSVSTKEPGHRYLKHLKSLVKFYIRAIYLLTTIRILSTLPLHRYTYHSGIEEAVDESVSLLEV